MSNYELHKESIGQEVWDDISGLRNYLSDLRHDQKLCNGLSFASEFQPLIIDVIHRIYELECKGEKP